VLILILLVIKRYNGPENAGAKSAKVPLFLIAFIMLMIINSIFTLPVAVLNTAITFSRFALITAIAAIGMKSNFSKLASVGFKPILLMVIETLWIAAIILIAILMS
jgi:uncharacterized membrane protein YadS